MFIASSFAELSDLDRSMKWKVESDERYRSTADQMKAYLDRHAYYRYSGIGRLILRHRMLIRKAICLLRWRSDKRRSECRIWVNLSMSCGASAAPFTFMLLFQMLLRRRPSKDIVLDWWKGVSPFGIAIDGLSSKYSISKTYIGREFNKFSSSKKQQFFICTLAGGSFRTARWWGWWQKNALEDFNASEPDT